MNHKTPKGWMLILLAGTALMALAPHSGFKTTTYYFLMIKSICLAVSFNLVAGYTGYISFGHVAFYGIGGYAAAILAAGTGFGAHTWICLPVGAAAAALAGNLLGRVLMRLRGAYFAIATLALNEALKVIMFNLPEDFSGGSFGIPLPELRAPMTAYYLMLGVTAGAVIMVYAVVHSRLGIALKAIREDEDAAMAMGIDAPYYKVTAFSLSTMIMGAAGAIDLQFIGYIYPEEAFFIERNVDVIAMTMLGGIGTIPGPILGAVILFIVSDFIWARWPFSHLIVLGFVLCGLVLFMRRGILGLLEDRVPSLRGKIK
jgi:branched-chain amino acid transport system permease protein